MFQKPFSFNGRIRRTEYGISLVIVTVIALIINAIAATFKGPTPMLLFYIPLLWFIFAQGAKRCHDLSHSGWYQIIPLYVFWMIFIESIKGINEYGLNPKGMGNNEESAVIREKELNIPPVNKLEESKVDIQQKEKNVPARLGVLFHKPIIKETKNQSKIFSAWEPETIGWVAIEDKGLAVFGPSGFTLPEKFFSEIPFFGPVFIKTLFSTIRDKKRIIPFAHISEVVAATRPNRSSMWDGGDSECGMIQIVFESSNHRSAVCAFSENGGSGKKDLPAFWKSFTVKLGADRLDIRDEAVKKMLQPTS